MAKQIEIMDEETFLHWKTSHGTEQIGHCMEVYAQMLTDRAAAQYFDHADLNTVQAEFMRKEAAKANAQFIRDFIAFTYEDYLNIVDPDGRARPQD